MIKKFLSVCDIYSHAVLCSISLLHKLRRQSQRFDRLRTLRPWNKEIEHHPSFINFAPYVVPQPAQVISFKTAAKKHRKACLETISHPRVWIWLIDITDASCQHRYRLSTCECEITTSERNKLSVVPIKWAMRSKYNFCYVQLQGLHHFVWYVKMSSKLEDANKQAL